MDNSFLKWFAMALAMLLLDACKSSGSHPLADSSINYSDTAYWYSCGDESRPADVFYVYPTVSTLSFEDNGSSWFADISLPEVREEANGNQRFNKMLYADYNFYAPYYRQMIFEAYSQPDSVLQGLARKAAVDVNAAFQYYMEHYNHGRPFFLMGHSQGSQMLIELLKHGMTEEQRQHMVAAYCIGYSITAEELADYPEALKLATDSIMQGVVVFNSVTDLSAVSPSFRNTVAGVNPLTWSEDTLFVDRSMHLGRAQYNDARDSIVFVPHFTGGRLVDHFMVCTDVDPGLVYIEAYKEMFPYGNLHFADSWLYGKNVVKNMQCRLRNL